MPSLSLEPELSRSHGSLYKALQHNEIDEEAVRELFVPHRPQAWALVFAVDASTWARCDAERSPGRGYYYSAQEHSADQPVVAGWSYQWTTELSFTPDSWTAPMDVMRLPLDKDATTATIAQVKRLVPLLPSDGDVPLFVFDAGYDAAGLSHGLRETRCEVLARIAETRAFRPDPPEHNATTMGRARRHGERFVLSDPATWTPAGATLELVDHRYGRTAVSAWHNLHPKLHGRGRWKGRDLPPIVRTSVLRVEVEHLPKATARGKKTLWPWWAGPGEPDLERCVFAYLRRFDIEHTFRSVKGSLAWTTPALCTLEQAGRWTFLVAAAYSELRLARGLVGDLRLPWERPCDPGRLTPHRVRRGFRPRPIFAHRYWHPPPRPQGVSTTACTPRHARPPTEKHQARSWSAERHQTTATNPLPGGQTGSLNGLPGFK
ncbi:MAG: transposase [Acidimicrobiales bacterium]